MRVRMTSIAMGPNVQRHPGQVVEVSDEEGKALLGGGHAEPVSPEATPSDDSEDESATAEAPERADSRRRRGR